MRDEAKEFKQRLEKACLLNEKIPPVGGGRYKYIADNIEAKVSHQAVQKWFTGSIPKRSMIKALARLLGVTELYLLGPAPGSSKSQVASDLLARNIEAHSMIAAGQLTLAGYHMAKAGGVDHDFLAVRSGDMLKIRVVPVEFGESFGRGVCKFSEPISEGLTYIAVAAYPGHAAVVFQWPIEALKKLNRRVTHRAMPVSIAISKGVPRVTSEKLKLAII